MLLHEVEQRLHSLPAQVFIVIQSSFGRCSAAQVDVQHLKAIAAQYRKHLVAKFHEHRVIGRKAGAIDRKDYCGGHGLKLFVAERRRIRAIYKGDVGVTMVVGDVLVNAIALRGCLSHGSCCQREYDNAHRDYTRCERTTDVFFL